MIFQINKDSVEEIADGSNRMTIRFGNNPGVEEINVDEQGNMSIPVSGNLTFYNSTGQCVTFRSDGALVGGRVSAGPGTPVLSFGRMVADQFPKEDQNDGKTVWLNGNVLTVSSPPPAP